MSKESWSYGVGWNYKVPFGVLKGWSLLQIFVFTAGCFFNLESLGLWFRREPGPGSYVSITPSSVTPIKPLITGVFFCSKMSV